MYLRKAGNFVFYKYVNTQCYDSAKISGFLKRHRRLQEFYLDVFENHVLTIQWQPGRMLGGMGDTKCCIKELLVLELMVREVKVDWAEVHRMLMRRVLAQNNIS
jgi:hypothetical protein